MTTTQHMDTPASSLAETGDDRRTPRGGLPMRGRKALAAPWLLAMALWIVRLTGFTMAVFSHGLAVAQTARLPTDCPRIVPQPVNWIVRVECDGSGKPQFVEHKWPVGSPNSIQTIRVPWGYRHLIWGASVGAQLMNNGHKPYLEQGYGSMHMWALLPGVTPHDQRNPPVVDLSGEFDLLTVHVTPAGPSFLANWNKKDLMRRRGVSLLRNLNIGLLPYRDIPVVALEGRFGLNRIGPERAVPRTLSEADKKRFWPPPHNDLWFDGATPETSEAIIVCGADYRSDGTRDPDNFPSTLCEQSFAHVGLNAGVSLTYWKKHHEHWRIIQERITALLNEFKIDIR